MGTGRATMKAVCLGTSLFVFASGVFAQPAASPLTFAVASIKLSPADARGPIMIGFLPGCGLRVAGVPLKNMITFAYDVRKFQISVGPGWINSERFDTDARAEASETPLPQSQQR